MYCAGHLIQAAVALRRGAGDDGLLAVAVRLADHLVREFAGQENGLDGHPIIETALAELYRETGNAGYLELARQFVDQRGRGLAGNSGLGRLAGGAAYHAGRHRPDDLGHRRGPAPAAGPPADPAVPGSRRDRDAGHPGHSYRDSVFPVGQP
jgi:hypothetical protein